MRVVLIFSLLFSAAMCGLVPSWWPSLVHRQPDNEFSLTGRASLLLRGSKDVSPEKLNRWLSKVEVLDECTNSTYSDPNGGLISSPNYPGNYSDDLSCIYLIDLRTSSAESVLLTFLDFQTEGGFDYVTVFDGPSISDRVLMTASGYAIPAPVRSTTPQMLVSFTTDYSYSDYNGFLATYSNGGPPTRCEQTYTDMTGNITSPNYPATYPDYQDCRYIIDLRSSGASSVTLTFLDFQTERGYDFVYVYEGISTSGALLLQASGGIIPRPVVSTTGQMLVRFTTDGSNVDNGFLATYEGN